MGYTKIEIIIGDPFINELLDRLQNLGATGYTAISISRGKGCKHGEQFYNESLSVLQSSLIFCIVKDELALPILQGISLYLKEHNGLAFSSKIIDLFGVIL